MILIGRLTKEPDVSEKVARYTLAVDRQFKQEGQPDADFINCVVFGKGIDFVSKCLHKGKKIAIEGRIQTGSYEKDGVKHYTTDIIVDRHEFCEKKTADSSEYAADYEADFKEVMEPESDNDLPF